MEIHGQSTTAHECGTKASRLWARASIPNLGPSPKRIQRGCASAYAPLRGTMGRRMAWLATWYTTPCLLRFWPLQTVDAQLAGGARIVRDLQPFRVLPLSTRHGPTASAWAYGTKAKKQKTKV